MVKDHRRTTPRLIPTPLEVAAYDERVPLMMKVSLKGEEAVMTATYRHHGETISNDIIVTGKIDSGVGALNVAGPVKVAVELTRKL